MRYFKKVVFSLTFITLVVSLTACASNTAKKSVTSQSNVSKSGKKHHLDYDDQKIGNLKVGTANHQSTLTRQRQKR
jgi:hypothetical protein